ncbi:hypothetical protein D7Y27_00720 [Corallococcus sp. AB004]|nr:hypothetical protein D7Y27_00720 [Corallococcus sp. AB004]
MRRPAIRLRRTGRCGCQRQPTPSVHHGLRPLHPRLPSRRSPPPGPPPRPAGAGPRPRAAGDRQSARWLRP